MFLRFDFATNNLHFATIFYHLVAKWRLNDFVNFEPCARKMTRGMQSTCKINYILKTKDNNMMLLN